MEEFLAILMDENCNQKQEKSKKSMHDSYAY